MFLSLYLILWLSKDRTGQDINKWPNQMHVTVVMYLIFTWNLEVIRRNELEEYNIILINAKHLN